MNILGWAILVLFTFGCAVFTAVQLLTYYPIQSGICALLVCGVALIERR
jgi:hypothetical protein